MALDPEIARQIGSLAAQADEHLAQNTPEGRAVSYHALISALELLPHKQVSEAAALFAKLGDVYFQGGAVKTALRAYTDAISSEGAIGDPALHLRLGKAKLELGKEALAADELCRAYMGGGAEIFEGQDPKYFDFLKTKILPPSDGKW